MKTAISVPDAIYSRAEQKAHELGWTRSQFYTTAAERFIDQIEREDLAVSIDAALEIIGDGDESADVAVAAGCRVVAAQDW